MTNRQMQYAYWQRMRQQQLYRAYAAGSSSVKKNAYDKICGVSSKTDPSNWFLNYIEYDAKNISPDKLNTYIQQQLKASQDQLQVGAMCTGVYKQGIVLRQLDWYYNKEAEFIIKMKKCLERGVKYDSIGTTAASPKLTVDVVRDHIENSRYNYYFDLLPYMTVDGVNEKGIFAQSNVVEENGVFPIQINTKSKIDCCCSIMLVRFILDHVGHIDGTDEDSLSGYLSTLHLYSAPKSLIKYNAHILVADADNHAKIIEFIKKDDGTYGFELVDCKEKNCQVMANFRTNGEFSTISSDTGISADWSTVEHNGMGVERWETGMRFVHDGNPPSVEAFKQLRSKFDYTHAYDRVHDAEGKLSVYDSMWLTDNLSDEAGLSVHEAKQYHDGTLASDRKQLFDNVLSGYRKLYDERRRDDGNQTWITTHSTIYDLANLSCNVVSQVGTTEQTEWNILSDGTMAEVAGSRTKVTYADGPVSSFYIAGELKSGNIKDKDNATKVEIGDDVTSIGEQALRECHNLLSVVMPESVKSIKNLAFSNCNSLSYANIPASVAFIGDGAFSGCNQQMHLHLF